MAAGLLGLAMFAFMVPAAGQEAGRGFRVERHGYALVVLNDNGRWGGPSMGTSHQCDPRYQVRKVIDLSVVPEEQWRAAKSARIRIFFALQDWSWNMPDVQWNGLDESFEIVVNGHSLRLETAGGFGGRAKRGDPLRWKWTDFAVPLSWLRRGENEIVVRKLPAARKRKCDDYIYVGIDNTASHGTSWVSFDGGKTWSGEALNAIGAQGEYMVRVVLVAADLRRRAKVSFGLEGARVEDSGGAVGFWEAEKAEFGPRAVKLQRGGVLAIEFDCRLLDPLEPPTLAVRGEAAKLSVRWLDDGGRDLGSLRLAERGAPGFRPAAPRARPWRVEIAAQDACQISELELSYSLHPTPAPPAPNMAPRIKSFKPGAPGKPRLRMHSRTVTVGDGWLEADLDFSDGAAARALRVFGRDVLLRPSPLFAVEISGQRYTSLDFACRAVRPMRGRPGVEAELALPGRLEAKLRILAEGRGQIRLALSTAPAGQKLAFKVAFPLVDGIDMPDLHYLFPYFGGLIADRPTFLRTAYGENSAWWQMIDFFSPAWGFGLALRVDDPTGLYKNPALRYGRSWRAEDSWNDVGRHMDPELLWKQSLPPANGAAACFEYLRRTRQPGRQFRPPDAVIFAHAGDFHEAMAEYSRWAHRVWKFRPYPGPLADIWNVTAVGWGKRPLVEKAGAGFRWRTDYLTEQADMVELMSWWQWSDLGPWRVPMQHSLLRDKLGLAFYKRYASYWVVDPATGRLRYPLNRGDYFYNEDWGGLAALRRQLQRAREAGCTPTFYVEGILACDTTEVGHRYGPKYGVKCPFWKDPYKVPVAPKGYVTSYGSWNMCCMCEWWMDYLARTVERICRDTGVAGVRLDELGHRGYTCYNDQHKHLFGEPGHNAWLQGVAEICRRVHRRMDAVRPGLILTTEFPGYDHMAAALDGSIVYEVAYHTFALRPLTVNLLRFYFPECKPYDLDYKHVPASQEIKLFNGMGAFGYRYSLRYLRLLRENSDCFGRGRAEALIAGPAERVYVNRFEAPGGRKVIYTVFNARATGYRGPVLELPARAGWHVVELASAAQLEVRARGQRMQVGAVMPRRGLLVVAYMPQVLSVRRDGQSLAVSWKGAGGRVVAANIAGDVIAEATGRGRAELKLPAGAAGPLIVKLFRGRYLADAVVLR